MTDGPSDDADREQDEPDFGDDDIDFLRAMQAIGVERREPPPAARLPASRRPVEQLPPEEEEDAVFEAAMKRMAAGLPPVARPSPAKDEATPAAAADGPVGPESEDPAREGDRPAQANPLFYGSERRLRRRLRKGEIEPQAELDLHRKRKGEALGALAGFLKQGQRAGLEMVLVITGKGIHSAELGVLKEMVPVMLASRWPDLVRQTIPAPPRLGGQGAFVVFLHVAKGQPRG